jgi:hypothetical protein
MILAVALAVVAPAAAKPTVMLFQERVVTFTERDLNLDVIGPLAKGLESTGKVTPILWSPTDPLISAAIKSGVLKTWPDKPSRQDVFRTSRSLGTTYVAFCKLEHRGGQLEGSIELFKGGSKPTWSSKASVSVIKDGRLDLESGVLSAASTWSAQMNSVPFKDLQGSQRVETPDPGDPSVIHSPIAELDKTPLATGRKALAEHRFAEAITCLRDAADILPLDPEVRISLIEALRLGGHPFLGASEAARAQRVISNDTRLAIAEAECWLDGDQPDKAYDLVSAVLGSKPNDAAALRLYGDLLVGKLEYARAADAYTQSFQSKKDPETLFKRAQTYALLEDLDKSLQDLEQSVDIEMR